MLTGEIPSVPGEGYRSGQETGPRLLQLLHKGRALVYKCVLRLKGGALLSINGADRSDTLI